MTDQRCYKYGGRREKDHSTRKLQRIDDLFDAGKGSYIMVPPIKAGKPT
jgi:hypothetical protein